MEDAGFATLSDDEEKDLRIINFGFVSIDDKKKD